MNILNKEHFNFAEIRNTTLLDDLKEMYIMKVSTNIELRSWFISAKIGYFHHSQVPKVEHAVYTKLILLYEVSRSLKKRSVKQELFL